ncbi:MAG TPA: NAD-dependent epimerase/dehydratase family protein [Isosphaeraceae bacterium]|nr:NAD-dependent epimerase/dehydratase family protein [Isosphaeraceae bacterium]
MTGAGLGTVLVTGGGGFLGTAVIRLLRQRGLSVRSMARRAYPHLRQLGVEECQGDIAELESVIRAVEGCDTVFHTAARAGIWGPEWEYHQTNVQGTQNVIAACRAAGSRRIIFTSSPSVVFNGRDLEGVDESAPYSSRFEAAYPKTKALAEQSVLRANSPELATLSLRPHLIWGPGDNNLLPRIIARARSGRLRRIGRRNPLIDPIYIDNAAEAHLLAADRLEPGSSIAGKAYFITQGETIPLWDMIDRLLGAANMGPVRRSIARPLALAAAGLLEAAYRLTGRREEPPMTRFLARQLSTTHWFNIDAARRDLGYEPRVSIAEGLARLERWLKCGVVA